MAADITSSITPPSSIGVRQIPTTDLIPNPHNPRLLFDKRPLEVLENSIAKVGILVPLTVYKESRTGKFVILDGQRRWICAQKVGLEQVPVNEVEEPNEVQNIVTMFQIHKFREDWELMPTALKLEVLMKNLEERGEKVLAELTGLDVAVVSRCKKLLTFPKKYQDMMLFANPKDRIKADFFIELYAIVTDRSLKEMKWAKRDLITERMLYKYTNRLSGIKSVTDFRRMKQHFSNARKVNKINILSKLFEEFIYSDDLTIDHLEVVDIERKKALDALEQGVAKLSENLENMDVKQFYGEEQFWRALERLFDLIRRKLQQADRRFE